jgi:hypothetical protein
VDLDPVGVLGADPAGRADGLGQVVGLQPRDDRE